MREASGFPCLLMKLLFYRWLVYPLESIIYRVPTAVTTPIYDSVSTSSRFFYNFSRFYGPVRFHLFQDIQLFQFLQMFKPFLFLQISQSLQLSQFQQQFRRIQKLFICYWQLISMGRFPLWHSQHLSSDVHLRPVTTSSPCKTTQSGVILQDFSSHCNICIMRDTSQLRHGLPLETHADIDTDSPATGRPVVTSDFVLSAVILRSISCLLIPLFSPLHYLSLLLVFHLTSVSVFWNVLSQPAYHNFTDFFFSSQKVLLFFFLMVPHCTMFPCWVSLCQNYSLPRSVCCVPLPLCVCFFLILFSKHHPSTLTYSPWPFQNLCHIVFLPLSFLVSSCIPFQSPVSFPPSFPSRISPPGCLSLIVVLICCFWYLLTHYLSFPNSAECIHLHTYSFGPSHTSSSDLTLPSLLPSSWTKSTWRSFLPLHQILIILASPVSSLNRIWPTFDQIWPQDSVLTTPSYTLPCPILSLPGCTIHCLSTVPTPSVP